MGSRKKFFSAQVRIREDRWRQKQVKKLMRAAARKLGLKEPYAACLQSGD